jgi:hypothetical protein
MPDEVVNFRQGDGLEKAITLMNVLKSRHGDPHLTCYDSKVKIKAAGGAFEFNSQEGFDISL